MYALIHNNQMEVGPRQWLWSAFKDYLDDNDLDSTSLPRKSPTEPIITNEWKILPVAYPDDPGHTYPFETLAGPFWTIGETLVTGVWNVIDITDINVAKGYFKGIVTNNRYAVEVGGFKTNIQGIEVSIDTSRDGRQIYLDTYLAMNNTETINWKFAESWIEVTKADMGQIVSKGKEHIQNCFTWEKDKWAEIDACTTRSEFESVELRHPLQPVPVTGLGR